MHHISKLKVKNFRSIADAEFKFQPFTPLIGKNNNGKSNVLQALYYLINGPTLKDSDFYGNEDEVEIEAEVSGVSKEVLEALGETHRPSIDKPELLFGGVTNIRRTASKGSTKLSNYFVRANDDNDWTHNPRGIDGAIKALFPSPIFIGAMQNLHDDLEKQTGTTTINLLFKNLVGSLAGEYAEEYNNLVDPLKQKLSSDGANKVQSLLDLDKEISDVVASFFPGIEVVSKVSLPDFGTIDKLTSFDIKQIGAIEGQPTDLKSMGHGVLRSVQLAMIKALAERGRKDESKAHSTLLLIDEPELYLFPQAIEVIREALVGLSKSGYQIVFSTHSPMMVDGENIKNTLFIHKEQHASKALPTVRSALEKNKSAQFDLLMSLSNSSRWMFSDVVLFAEGKTERLMLPNIFQKHVNASFGAHGLGFVELGGVNNLNNARKIIQDVGKANKSIVDLDYAFGKGQGLEMGMQGRASDYQACKNELASLKANGEITLNNEGWPNKGVHDTAALAYEFFAKNINTANAISNICAYFLEEFDIWVWRYGAIEAALGIEKTPQAKNAFIKKMNSSDLVDILPENSGVIDCLEWLKS